jgi:hypothetical protein
MTASLQPGDRPVRSGVVILTIVVALMLVRLLAAAALVMYLRRDADWFQWKSVVTAIHLVSTMPERILLGALAFAFLAAARYRLPSTGLKALVAQAAFLAIAFAGYVALLRTFGDPAPARLATVLVAFLAVDAAAEPLYRYAVRALNDRRGRARAVVALIATELISFKALWHDLLGRIGIGRWLEAVNRQATSAIPAIAMTAVLCSATLDTAPLSAMHRSVFHDAAVVRIATGDFNNLAYDADLGQLFASGHGLSSLHAYAAADLAAAPRVSTVPSGFAQGFSYNAVDKEIYLYNWDSRALLTLDANTLTLKRSFPFPNLAPGDVWLTWDPMTDSIVVASEADIKEGVPFAVINRQTGQVTDTQSWAPGFILQHPAKPELYLNFFRRDNRLIAYDLPHRRIVRQRTLSAAVDRMRFAYRSADALTLLVTAPTESQVLMFDAESLESVGSISTVFGVRALAVDAKRQFVLTGSLIDNYLDVVDLATKRSRRRFYVGPWLREIELNMAAGVAYVSSYYGLFAVTYAPPL